MSQNRSYRIDLEMFEGPLDLLLFLIKKDELNIYDIPIAQITRDFLKFVEMAKELRLHSAGDFILMAATLMKIKARMLLPVEDTGDEEIEDPRSELISMLLEYKRFKEASASFSEMETRQRPMYYRIPGAHNPVEEDPSTLLADVKLYDIMLTFQYLLKNYEEPDMHAVAMEEVTLSEQVSFLVGLLQSEPKLYFTDLMERFQSRMIIVVTFLAILEMIRGQRIRVRQTKLFDDLVILKGRHFGTE